MKAEQGPQPIPEGLQLLFDTANVSAPEKANELSTELKNKGTLYYEDDNILVSKYEEPPNEERASYIHYQVFDPKNGLPNYRASYKKTGRKTQVWEITTWGYKQNPEDIHIDVTINSLYKEPADTAKEIKNTMRTALYKLDSRTLRYTLKATSTATLNNADIHKIENQIHMINSKANNSPKQL